jgi:hypothetical protein
MHTQETYSFGIPYLLDIVSYVLSYVGLVLRDILSEAEILILLKEIPRSGRMFC